MRLSFTSAFRPTAGVSPRRRRLRRSAQLLSLLLVVPLCVSLALASIGRTPAGAPGEPRAPWPDAPRDLADVNAYLPALGDALEARLVGRRTLLRGYGHLAEDLGASGDIVIAGQNGWLFYAAEGTLTQYQGVQASGHDPRESWRRTLPVMHDAARSAGAGFVALIPPNKNRVFAEYMPAWAGPPAQTRVIRSLLDDPDLRAHGLLDIEPALLAAKALTGAQDQAALYFPRDTHWTFAGARIAAEAIVASPAGQAAYAGRAELPGRMAMRDPSPADLDTLSGREGTRGPPVQDLVPRDSAQFPRTRTEPPGAEAPIASFVLDGRPGQEGPTVVLIGDSFAESIAAWLAQAGARVVFVHHRLGRFSWSEVMSHAPDLVVLSVVERYASHELAPTDLDLTPAPRAEP